MSFSERQEYKLEVIPPYSVIQVRRADVILKDDVEVARSYHRHVVVPGADLSEECAEVNAVADALWTADVISAYQASVDSSAE